MINDVPEYARVAAISTPKPVEIPNFGKGRGVGGAFNELQKLYDIHDQNNNIDSALSEIAAQEISNLIKQELADEGHVGYLLLVRRFKHKDSGAVRSGFEGPIPVGSGNSPADAVARNVLLSDKSELNDMPAGHVYDPERSFTIWVTDENGGDLTATPVPYPHSLYRSAQGLIVNGAVENLSVAEDLAQRSRKYERAAKIALETQEGKSNAAAISSLLRTRKNLADAVQRSQDLLRKARSEEKNAANWAKIQKFLSTAGYATSKLAEGAKKASKTSVKVAETHVNNDIRNYNHIENRLNLTINVYLDEKQDYEPLPYLP